MFYTDDHFVKQKHRMDRVRRLFSRGRTSTRRVPSEGSETSPPGRSFENPHRCQSPGVTLVFSEFKPGLGRKVPELVAAGEGFFEIHYKNNYERRVDWAYSPKHVPVYRKIKDERYIRGKSTFSFEKDDIKKVLEDEGKEVRQSDGDIPEFDKK